MRKHPFVLTWKLLLFLINYYSIEHTLFQCQDNSLSPVRGPQERHQHDKERVLFHLFSPYGKCHRLPSAA
jgi:hypothetical protein